LKQLVSKKMKLKVTTGFLLVFLSAFTVNAQFTGFTAELDTVFFGADTPSPDDPFDPEGNLEFYGTYKIYANFTNAMDALSALYADVGTLDTPPMFINAPCGCHNPVTTSVAMDASNTSAFWVGPFADWQYDTYWTIGMPSSDAPGFIPQGVGLPSDGVNVCSDEIVNGSIFTIGMPQNAMAGDDLKILIAQVTTCGDFSLSACVQVFINGEQEDIQYECPDLLEVTHLFDDGECVNDADDDGICDEFEVIGCMEEAACNFDPAATDNTGGCDYTCYGCTDPYSCNFSENSSLDDGSCEYTSCAGCSDPFACNFNPGAWLDDGTCEYLSCAGCTIPEACNYDPAATIDNSSCILPGDACDDGDSNSYDDFIQTDCSCNGYGCDDPDACNYSATAIPGGACNFITLYDINGETNPNAVMLLSYSYPNTTGSTYVWVTTSGDVEDGEGTANVEVAWWGDGAGSICVTETNSGGCSGEQVCMDVDINPVSLDELNGQLPFIVYPSPATSAINIQAPTLGTEGAIVQIRDMAGRVVISQSVDSEATIDVSDLARGSYLVRLISDENHSLFRRIILN
jgi:hypothetical protein